MTFIGLLSYEIIYWSGIYLNVWEYHAKDVFTEVPIHCAHVNIRLNIINRSSESQLKEYYDIKNKSRYHNILYWKQLNDLSEGLFKLNKFVKYYFEFSPDDFEMNKEPEFGSTVLHLRAKILKLFNESELYRNYEKPMFNLMTLKYSIIKIRRCQLKRMITTWVNVTSKQATPLMLLSYYEYNNIYILYMLFMFFHSTKSQRVELLWLISNVWRVDDLIDCSFFSVKTNNLTKPSSLLSMLIRLSSLLRPHLSC